MRRSGVLDWLEKNGGQKDIKIEYKEITNPKYTGSNLDTTTPAKIQIKYVTWEANNGRKLTVIDRNPEGTTGDGSEMGPQPDPDYDFVADEGKDESKDGRSPESREKEQEAAREARWNRDTPIEEGGSGRYETHEQRRQRERQEEDDRQKDEDRRRRTEADTKANDLKEEELRIRREAEERAGRQATEAGERDKERIGIERERTEISRQQANRPNIIGSPTYKDKWVGQQNADGSVTYVDNPIYDELRAKAEEKREELRDAIAHNQMTAQVAAQKYKEWYDKEVAVPLALAKERREQAAERRSAQQAADEERRFAAKYEVDRANVGQAAAESAQANERALLPYRVGPKFGGQFSSAVNGLSGKMDQNSEAGINFTADAFEFKRPDFSGIARKATADALKHLTPYQPTDVSKYATADYSGITMPTSAPTGAPAPESPSYIDTSIYLPPQG